MSNGVNKVIIIGRLGQDPDVRYTASGGAVANLSLATSESWIDKQTGEKKEKTEWHKVVLFNRLAEIAGQYLAKGSQVYIEGKLTTEKWEQDGVTRYTTKVIANSLQMLGGGRSPASGGSEPQQPQTQSDQQGFEDDIPF